MDVIDRHILHLLEEKWFRASEEPDAHDGSPDAEVSNAYERGKREVFKECAEDLRAITEIF